MSLRFRCRKESRVKVWSGISSRANRRFTWAVLAVVLASLLGVVLGGCDVDSFMDPSVVGRWENTPVVLPILERLDVIDEPVEQIPGLSEIRSEDLIPEIREYVMGPGDLITVTIFELIQPGIETVQTRRIDELGYIRLPVVGQVKLAGLTTKQAEQRLVDILDPDILKNPMVTVIVQEGRQKTFAVMGGTGTGTYAIVQNNFRLLDAIALARGIPPSVTKLYVIRQVPLSDMVEKGFQPTDEPPGAHQPPMTKTGRQGEAAPGRAPVPLPGGGAAAPGGAAGNAGGAGNAPKPLDPGALIENLSKGLDDSQNRKPEPPKPSNNGPLNQGLEQPGGDGRFVNINGKWVWVEATAANKPAATAGVGSGSGPGSVTATSTGTTAGSSADGTLPPPEQLVTQRVIEVDAEALIRGEARYNIVIRPNDVIRVPSEAAGNVFIGGSISRGGTYALPQDTRMTLKQLVIAAGGLSPVAIPERVDLIRRIGKQQEVTLRLNLRSIYEGLQPDIFLKGNDTINVGTNFFASFAAVIRNSFRMSYGFGFLMDRNFGSDIFGAAPDSAGAGR
jgi:polysaccharide export outer membrane protein